MLCAQSPAVPTGLRPGACRDRIWVFSRKHWDRSKTSSCEVMSSQTQFQRGLVLLPAVPRLPEHPVPLLRACASAGSRQRLKQRRALLISKAKGKFRDSHPFQAPRASLWCGGPGCAAPTAPWSSVGGGWGRCYPALGLLPGVEGLQRERCWMQKSLHQEQQEEQAGVANAESGHTVSPSKRRRRCSSAGRCNLGKMKLSIMHLSPHSPLPGWRGRALSHPMFNSMLSAPEPWLQTHPGLMLCAS